VAEEARALAERTISEWQRLAEERRLVGQEHEQQLLKLSQVCTFSVRALRQIGRSE